MHKKGHPLPAGLETLLGVGGRRGLKGGIKKLMEWLLANHPQIFYEIAFIFTNPKAASVKTTFQGFLIAVGSLLENLGDKAKVPEGFMELVEILFGDLPGALQDYFEANKPTFPAGFKEPDLSLESIKTLAGKFNDLVKSYLRGLMSKWQLPTLSFIERMLTDPRQRMFKNLARLPEPEVRKFFANIEKIGTGDRNYLAQCLNLIDDLDELAFYASRSESQLKQLIGWAKTIDNQALLKRIWREATKQAKKHWPTLERVMVEKLRQLDRELGRAEAALTTSNLRRQRAINRERFSQKNMKDKPWLSDELKEGDPRRIEQPGLVRRLATNPLVWVVVGFILLTTVVGVAVGVSGLFREPPTVTITSPMNDAKVSAAPIISGEARDAERVSSMEYQVNNGNRLPLSISPARRVRWSVQVDSSTYGMIHVVVYAKGENGKVGTSELHLFRSEPAPPVVAPDSGLIAASVVIDTLGDNRVRLVRTVRLPDGRVERDSVKLQVIQ